MIATLSGRLRARQAGRLVVEAGGVGYEVFVPLGTYYRMPALGEPVALEIRQVVREDSLSLYGFSTPGEKRAFDLLLGIQHVGPKLALAILSVLSPDELVGAIMREDIDRIDAVPGVGPKVAERVVRELRNKAAELKLVAPAVQMDGAAPAGSANGAGAKAGGLFDEAVSALVNLDYKPVEARRAVELVVSRSDASGVELEAVIRKSLALLLGEK